MKLYQVRRFENKQWLLIRTYAIYEDALEFAQQLTCEWDVHQVTLDEANKVCA